MEKAKKQVSGSSTSITCDLFGPKESSKSPGSANGAFGSFFGPSSTGLGKDSSGYGTTGTSRNQDYGTHYSNGSHGTSDCMEQRNKGKRSGITKKDSSSIYQNDRAEPCYFNSSIYYGAQEVYSPATHTTSHHLVRKDVQEDDDNGNVPSSASRGNWWQGSLYY